MKKLPITSLYLTNNGNEEMVHVNSVIDIALDKEHSRAMELQISIRNRHFMLLSKKTSRIKFKEKNRISTNTTMYISLTHLRH